MDPATETAEKKEPKAKKAKTPKEPKEPRIARPRLPRFPDEHVITVLKPKAKTGASGERYDQYKTGMTVKQYVDLMTAEPWKRTVGQVFTDMRWDTDPNRKLVNIGPTVVDIPPPAQPAA